jgi:dolichol kinase
MKEGTLPRVLNGIGAVLALISAILGGLFRFPDCFLPGATFPLGVAIFLAFEVVNQHPPSSVIPKENLSLVFSGIRKGKISALVIGAIFTIASGIPALILFFMLHETVAGLSMALLAIAMATASVVGTLVDRWEISRVI